MRQGRIIFHELADFIAVANRHENVSQNQIRLQIGNFANGGFAIAHGNDFNTLIFQGENYHLLNVAVVVRNQDLGHRTSSAAPTHTSRGLSGWSGLTRLLEHWRRDASTQTAPRCVGREHAYWGASSLRM